MSKEKSYQDLDGNVRMSKTHSIEKKIEDNCQCQHL